MKSPLILLSLLIVTAAAGVGFWFGQNKGSVSLQKQISDSRAKSDGENRERQNPMRQSMAHDLRNPEAEVSTDTYSPGHDIVQPAASQTKISQEPHKIARQMEEPVFMVPLAFAPEKAPSSRRPVTMNQARARVPGAFAGQASVSYQKGLPPNGSRESTPVGENPATDDPQMEGNLELLRNQFVETVRASGVSPDSPQYLEVWESAQIAIDRQYAIWYGADRAMAKQADAYKSAHEHARAAAAR